MIQALVVSDVEAGKQVSQFADVVHQRITEGACLPFTGFVLAQALGHLAGDVGHPLKHVLNSGLDTSVGALLNVLGNSLHGVVGQLGAEVTGLGNGLDFPRRT